MRHMEEPLTSVYTLLWACTAQAKTIKATRELSMALMRRAKMTGWPSWKTCVDSCMLKSILGLAGVTA